jgi:hypothetical protein
MHEFINFSMPEPDSIERIPSLIRGWLENKPELNEAKLKDKLEEPGLNGPVRDQIVLVFRQRRFLKGVLSKLDLLRDAAEVDRLVVMYYLQTMEANRNAQMEKVDVMERKRAIYDNLDVYLRDHLYTHMAKMKVHDFDIFKLASTFKVANIFKQIVSFGSYQRFCRQLVRLV